MTVVMMTTSLNVTDGTFKYGTKFMKPTQTLQMDHFRRILAAFSTDGTSHSHVLQAPLEPDAVKVRRKRKMGILKKKKKKATLEAEDKRSFPSESPLKLDLNAVLVRRAIL